MPTEPVNINSDTRLEGDKRIVPPFLKAILKKDIEVTKKFTAFCLNFSEFRSFKNHCKFLEWSCHGVIWLAGLIALTYLFGNKSNYEVIVNLFAALILDIFVVAIVKAIVRRRRPSVNDDPFCIGPDVYSFPSGHASRSSLILGFFIGLYPISIFFWPPMFAWWFAIAVSRLLLYRHHILDVVAGIFIGFFEALIMGFLWIGPDTAANLVSWISDDRISGSDAEII